MVYKSIKNYVAGAALAAALATGALTSEVKAQENYSGTQIQSRGMSWGSVAGLSALGVFSLVTFCKGIRIVTPTERGLVERLGRYHRFAEPGLNWIIPYIDKMRRVDITEKMINAEPQEVITKDNLNAKVDAQIYFKVKADEEGVKGSQYNVADYKVQIVSLARTTLRSIIGTLSLKEANSERNRINGTLATNLTKEVGHWGIEIVRAELKEIDPPQDVQATMNKVVKAENEKIAAVDYATAAETEADGKRRMEIKKAEGIKQAKILEAEGEAEAIKRVAEARATATKLTGEAATQYFTENARKLKELEVAQATMANNSKYFIPAGTSLVAMIGSDKPEVVPVPVEVQKEERKK